MFEGLVGADVEQNIDDVVERNEEEYSDKAI